MKSIFKYTNKQWLALDPLWFLLKQIRNDIFLWVYCNIRGKGEKEFLNRIACLKDKKIVVVVAFEQPRVLDWCLSAYKLHQPSWQLLVFDNSRNIAIRSDIENIASKYSIPYLALPRNLTRHPNRSHGMAMTWIYRRIIEKVKPKFFGYLDHDMILTSSFEIAQKFDRQPCFGLHKNMFHPYWNLWAGYCFYRYEEFANKKLNFLYDFSCGLDTGGRNYELIYKPLIKENVEFASMQLVPLIQSDGSEYKLQVIDNIWVHIGAVSYNGNFPKKENLFTYLMSQILIGQSIQSIVTNFKSADF